jgi:hypothetical protein
MQASGDCGEVDIMRPSEGCVASSILASRAKVSSILDGRRVSNKAFLGGFAELCLMRSDAKLRLI